MFASFQRLLDIDEIYGSKRKIIFEKQYEFKDGVIQFRDGQSTTSSSDVSDSEYSIYFSFVPSDQKYAVFLDKCVKNRSPNITFKSSNHGDKVEDLEKANLLVVFLSKLYLKSRRDIEELNLILSRKRSNSSCKTYVITTEQLPAKPTYVHLVDCHTHLEDDFWMGVSVEEVATEVSNIGNNVQKSHGQLRNTEMCALMKAACDLAALREGKR